MSHAPPPNWPPNLDRERMARMFERPASLSVIVFDRDVSERVPSLLAQCRYSILKTERVRSRVGPLYVRCESTFKPGGNIVGKAAFVAGGHTFLLEPEMIMITEERAISEFCKQQVCRCVAGVWERASETVMLFEFAPNAIRTKTWYCQGRPEKDNLNPLEVVARSPNHPGLLAGMRSLHVPLDLLAHEVDATLYELQ